jgi:hypothetical protein
LDAFFHANALPKKGAFPTPKKVKSPEENGHFYPSPSRSPPGIFLVFLWQKGGPDPTTENSASPAHRLVQFYINIIPIYVYVASVDHRKIDSLLRATSGYPDVSMSQAQRGRRVVGSGSGE